MLKLVRQIVSVYLQHPSWAPSWASWRPSLPQLGVSRNNLTQAPQNPSAIFPGHIMWLGPSLRRSARLVWAPRPCEDKVCLQINIRTQENCNNLLIVVLTLLNMFYCKNMQILNESIKYMTILSFIVIISLDPLQAVRRQNGGFCTRIRRF